MISSATAKKETRRPQYRSPISLCLVTAVIMLLTSVGYSQTTTSTLEGTVRDANGALVAGAQVKAASTTLATERTVITDAEGQYRIVSLPAGMYTLTVTQPGFSPHSSQLELTLNRTAVVDISLQVGAVDGNVVNVGDEVPLLTPDTTAVGSTITPKQISDLPVNGRDYLDLLQLVPGTAVNRQANPDSDNATPVLGERSGNNNFFIDGQPNKDTVDGGPAAQFNQETIAEFQVLTTGYKAEFGQASGAIINVITKSGGNRYNGVFSLFHRNDVFDSSNSLDATRSEAPELSRYDYSLATGGPIIRDRFFFFGSAERITERRELDFNYPDTGNATVNGLIRSQEEPFDNPSRTYETRAFLKFNQTFSRHNLMQEVNYTNRHVTEFLPLSLSGSLPSRRNDVGARRLLHGFSDTMLLGDLSDPWTITLRGGYRGEPTATRPSHPDAGAATVFFPFSSNSTGTFFGDFPSVSFGNPNSLASDDQRYTTLGAHAAKQWGDHGLKFGWNFVNTKVDGISPSIANTQLFATANDFATFGAINSGFFTVTTIGGLTPDANLIRLRNNYNGLYFQDDWRVFRNLTLNLGLRWDYDSEFDIKNNFSPRLGVAWAVDPKTVIRGHFGYFYDNFRLGLASQVPAFGGADRRVVQPFSYPRGFFGVPTLVVALVNGSLFPPNGLCVSPNLTDAQITSTGATCPVGPTQPYIGIDRLNRVVAAGRSPIPANAVINQGNVQSLSGLSPDQYLTQAAAAVGKPNGFFFWGPFGALTHGAVPAQLAPTTVDNDFATPYTIAFSIGVQRELTKDLVFEADYHHREVKNVLGLRHQTYAFSRELRDAASIRRLQPAQSLSTVPTTKDDTTPWCWP